MSLLKTVVLAGFLSLLIPVTLLLWICNVFLYTYKTTPDAARPLSPFRWLFGLLVPLLIVKWGLKRRSLDKSGAVTGFFIGVVLILSSYCFFAALLTFFVLGSKVTKYKAKQKQKMEADFKEGGQRNWLQVICNGGIAAEIALLYMIEAGGAECVVDFSKAFTPSWFAMGVLGSLASSNGDTFASEIGSVWGNKCQPWLITSFKRVPKGTNGGVSLIGTLASIVGGGLVGAAYYIALLLCVPSHDVVDAPPQYLIVAVGAIAGATGSLIDSFLGATFQYSGYHEKRGVIVEHPGPGITHISGAALLDNHSVNLITSLLMAWLTPYIALHLLGYYV